MEKKNDFVRAISSIVLGSFLAILLCAPSVRADLVVPSGQTLDINTDVGGFLEIFGTANLYSGAYADFIFAYPGAAVDAPGSIVNIYGCAPNNSLAVLEASGSMYKGLPPVVTVYGYRFRIDAGLSFGPPADMPVSGTLHVLDELEEELFNIWIASDIDIRLRAPESSEPQRIEAELYVSPSVMNRQRMYPVVFAKILLPEDIKKDDVDNDYPLMIYTLENENGVQAKYKRISHTCISESSQVRIFAFFNIGTLLKNLPDNCEEMQLEVRGRLKSEQEFYGKDKIKILKPHRKHWSYWKNWKPRNSYRHR
ncbi:MAG: hypothetical protein JW837_13340 [Sedimentisphaerales bacterium]|nr:hypothetical protein [Sedimentisphaerales bacterium]